jgi:hypothetical protein
MDPTTKEGMGEAGDVEDSTNFNLRLKGGQGLGLGLG